MTLNKNIKEWVQFIRDIGVIAGVPALLYFVLQVQGIQEKSFEAQTKSLEAQVSSLKNENEILKEHQYDRADAVIKAQKSNAENELDLIQNNIQMLGDNPPDIRNFNKMMCLKLDRLPEKSTK
jgi:hypothetical protein